MDIRPVQPEDAKAFAELLFEIDQSGFMLFEPNERAADAEREKRRIDAFVNDKHSALFVAEENGQLGGYMMALGGKANRNKHSAYLVLGVHEQFQRQGIASRLFNETFQWAKNNGITRLELTVIKNNEKALRLYKKVGFKIEGEKINSLFIDGKPVNEYYMYKLI
ncbi:GNAT family N-acetyltransferase [Bacillus gobiensis]|uniref:GNAT family N-acetyltransferase n=1 Tax=Bacillus gobiensis TaxID=1441095 RepID=UPI003D24E8C9